MPLVHNILIRDPMLVIAYKALKGDIPIYLEDIMIMHEIVEFKDHLTPKYDEKGELISSFTPKKSNGQYAKPTPEMLEEARKMREKLGIEEKIKEARRNLGIEC